MHLTCRSGGQIENDGGKTVAPTEAQGRPDGDKLPTSDEESFVPVDVGQYEPKAVR